MEVQLFAVGVGDEFLRTSPEFALKRVVASGLPRVYEIGPCYREREQGDWHRREFTMLEWYRVGANLDDLMAEVRALVGAVAKSMDVENPSPWEVVTVRELFSEIGIDLSQASASDLSAIPGESWDDGFFRRWVTEIEPRITGPTFVRDWPASQAALAKVRSDGDWPYAERFEVYHRGVELGNAFLELIDGAEQLRRFVSANTERLAAGESPHPIDRDFVESVSEMPRTAGIAIGIDRLVAGLLGMNGIPKTLLGMIR